MRQFPAAKIQTVDGVPFTESEERGSIPIEVERPRAIQRRPGDRGAVGGSGPRSCPGGSLDQTRPSIDAAHAMVPSAGQGACQAFEDAYILGRWLEACSDPVEAFAGFRRIRIPRVHGVQRLSLANNRFKHMDSATLQKQAMASGHGGFHGNIEWVWGFDPVAAWDREPDVPAIYAADA